MSTAETEVAGTLALVGGGEWRDGTRDLDAPLLEASGGKEVLVLPTAAAYEHPDRVVERGEDALRASSAPRSGRCRSCTGREAESADDLPRRCATPASSTSPTARRCTCARCSRARRSSTRCSPPTAAARCSPRRAPAPRSSATRWSTPAAAPTPSGSAWCEGLAVFPYHGSAADHLRERSIDLLPPSAVLVGIDEETALAPRARRRAGRWPAPARSRSTRRRRTRTGQRLPQPARPPDRAPVAPRQPRRWSAERSPARVSSR